MNTATERLNAAEGDFAKAAAEAADRHLAAIDAFLDSREAGIKQFSTELFSLSGKWKFIKGKLRIDPSDEHTRFIQESFTKKVFQPEELTQVVNSAVAAWAAEIAGLENALLIRLRADLSSSDSDIQTVIPSTRSEAAFHARFDKAAAEIRQIISRDLKTDVAREIGSWIIADIGAKIGIRVMQAIAVKLGVQAGILGGGAASGLATFGIGLVIAVLVDLAVDKVLELTGNDAVTITSKRVSKTLHEIISQIKTGIPEAHTDWKELTALAASDPDPKVRGAAAQAADSIAKSGNLGLRHEMIHLNQVRSAIRVNAIRNLIMEDAR